MPPRTDIARKGKCPAGKQLDRLTAEQQEHVYAHCKELRLRDGVAWLKEQFAISLAESSLRLWLRKERVRRDIAARLDKISDARDGARLISAAIGSAKEITEANLVLLAQAAFEEFLKEPEQRNAKLLGEYMAFALRARDLELRGSANELAREKHYYDLAKKSLEYVEQLKGINDSDDDERAKIDKAMVLLFGERPEITDFRDMGTELPEKEGKA
jgi:hypothetical protein